ncbi:MAG: YceD family protein [Pseudomonadales bacterium]|nr:YceD family protein [Pseudomonadales bacterium]
MSFDPFPERIDAYQLFVGNSSINSEIPLSRFKRLKDYLSHDKGLVQVELNFNRDENQYRRVSGRISTKVQVLCQRCLQETSLELSPDVNVLVVSDDAEAQAMLLECESVQADDKGLDLLALVEDELILSLPIVAYHAENCRSDVNNGDDRKSNSDIFPGKAKVFDVLRNLKK